MDFPPPPMTTVTIVTIVGKPAEISRFRGLLPLSNNPRKRLISAGFPTIVTIVTVVMGGGGKSISLHHPRRSPRLLNQTDCTPLPVDAFSRCVCQLATKRNQLDQAANSSSSTTVMSRGKIGRESC